MEKNKGSETGKVVKMKTTSKSKREAYIEKLAEQLKKWDHEMEEFEKKSEKKLSDLKVNLTQKIESLRVKRDELRVKLNRVEDLGEEAFQNIKKDIEKLWKDTRQGFKTIRKEFRK